MSYVTCVCTCVSVCIVLRRSLCSDLVLARRPRLSADLRAYSARSRCLHSHIPNRSEAPETLVELRHETEKQNQFGCHHLYYSLLTILCHQTYRHRCSLDLEAEREKRKVLHVIVCCSTTFNISPFLWCVAEKETKYPTVPKVLYSVNKWMLMCILEDCIKWLAK